VKCLSDFIRDNKLDFVRISKTKKANFIVSFLDSVSRNFAWHFVPAKGAAGGILVGLKSSSFNILSCQDFKVGTTIMVQNLIDNSIWRLVVIYGTPYDDKKMEFIDELHLIMRA
jgi:hypothetical protein